MEYALEQYQRVCAHIDLDAIISNMDNMHAALSEGTRMVAVIKTDGYGHGAVQIARELEQLGYVWGYAVATAEEAFILRQSEIQKPILILGYTFPYADERLISMDIRPTIFRMDQAQRLSKAAAAAGREVRIHIKVDTAMSRIGIRPDDTGIAFIREVMGLKGICVEGLFTHFARADEADKSALQAQLSRYRAFLGRVQEECPKEILLKHCANSAGILEMREADMDLVRAGITLYGLWPSEEMRRDGVRLTPALSLKSTVVFVKEIEAGTPVSYGGTFVAQKRIKVATIPVGYGDGYPRSLSNKGEVLIRGKRARILGRVCMDQFMVDVTDIEGAAAGDEVTLIGRDGEDSITMEEVGAVSGRFNYELACDISKRVPRVYRKGGKVTAAKDYYDDLR